MSFSDSCLLTRESNPLGIWFLLALCCFYEQRSKLRDTCNRGEVVQFYMSVLVYLPSCES
jgi:hypothetical protein